MATLASLGIRMFADTVDFVTDMNRATKLSKRSGKEMERAMKKAGAAIGAAFVAATVEAAGFEKKMAEVSTLMDGAGADIEGLGNKVLSMSQAMGTDAKENASALYQIISAGASDSASAMDLLTVSNKLAIGGITDVKTAADGLTSVLNAYGMTAADADRVGNIMFATMKAGKTTIGELSGSVGQVVTLAAQAGVSFEELGAATATLTKRGIATSEAMTAVRSMLVAVTKGSTESMEAADELGIQFSTSAIRAMGFANWLGHVAEKTGMSDEKLSKLFGRVEGLTGVLALGADGAREFNGTLQDIYQSTSLMDEAFAKMQDTVSYQFDKLKSTLNVLLIQIGGKFLPALNDWLGALVWLIEKTGLLETATDDAKVAAGDYAAVARGLAGDLADVATEEIKLLRNDARRKWRDYETQVQGVKAEMADLLLITQDLTGADREAVVQSIKSSNKYRELEERLALLNDQKRRAMEAIQAYNKEMERAPRVTDDAKRSAKEFGELVDASTRPAIIELGESLAYVSMLIDMETDPALQEITTTADGVSFAAAKAAGDIENLGNKLGELSTRKPKEEFAGFTAVIEQAWQSLDTTFQSIWTNFFETGKLSLDSIKDLFLQTLAQMAHQAITRPIVMQLGASMGLGGGSAAGGGLFGGGFGAFLGDLAMPLAIGSMIGGDTAAEQWGSGIGALGGMFATGAIASGIGAMAASGGVFASILGGIGTQTLNFIIPVIGPLIGALLGKAIGKLLARDPEVTFQGSNYAAIEEQSLFGGFDVRARGGTGPQEDPDSFAGQAIAAIREFDDALGSFMSDSQIAKIVEAMKSWRVNLKNSAVTIENILESRFAVVLSTFSQAAQDYVRGFDGLEGQTQALAEWVQAFNVMGSVLAEYVGSSLPDLLEAGGQAKSSTEVLRDMASGLRDLFATFDGTPESMREIAETVAQRYEAEIRYIRAIDQLILDIGQSIERQRQSLREMMGVGENQTAESYLGDARKLLSELGTASSPEEIAQIVAQIQQMIEAGKSLASALPGSLAGIYPMRGMTQEDFVSLAIQLLDEAEALATARAQALRDEAVAEAEALRAETQAFADAQHIDLMAIQTAADGTTAAVQDQTSIIADGNAAIIGELSELNLRMTSIELIQQQQLDLAGSR